MPPRLPCNLFSSDPRRQTVDEQRCTHRYDEDDDNSDNERFHHIPCVDLFLVPVRDCDADADVCAPDHDHARKRLGWSDEQVVIRWVIVQCVASAVLTVLAGFGA